MFKSKTFYYFLSVILIVIGSFLAFGTKQEKVNGKNAPISSKVILGVLLAVIGLFLLMKEMSASYNMA